MIENKDFFSINALSKTDIEKSFEEFLSNEKTTLVHGMMHLQQAAVILMKFIQINGMMKKLEDWSIDQPEQIKINLQFLFDLTDYTQEKLKMKK